MATERGSLGVGQRLVLLGAWLVSCGFVYVLGFYVGKGMRGDGQPSPRVALPVDAAIPPAPPPEAQGPLTFYDVLGSREGARPGAPAGPAAAARPAQPAAVREEKLPPAAPQAPAVRPPAPAAVAADAPRPPPAAARPTPAPAAAAPPRVDTASAPGAVAAAPAAPPAVAPPPPAPPAAPPVVAAAPVAPALPPQSANGRWTVYASPTRDQLAVQHERAALRAKGYPAEVVTMRRDGDTWYRIRVGRYATEAQAEEASRRLRSEGIGHGAFVQSE